MAPLKAVLNEIYAASIPLEERRYLAERAVDSLLGQAAGQCGQEQLLQLEQVLLMVAKRAGKSKINITDAKAWLRGHGPHAAKLASRLSRLSKTRNGVAHPDVALLQEVELLQNSDADSCSTATSLPEDSLSGSGTCGSDLELASDACKEAAQKATAPSAATATAVEKQKPTAAEEANVLLQALEARQQRMAAQAVEMSPGQSRCELEGRMLGIGIGLNFMKMMQKVYDEAAPKTNAMTTQMEQIRLLDG